MMMMMMQTSWQTDGENRNKFYFVSNSLPTCLLLLRRSHTPTRVCQHELANSLSCEGRLMCNAIHGNDLKPQRERRRRGGEEEGGGCCPIYESS